MAKLLQEIQEMKDHVVENYYKQALVTNQFVGRNFDMALKLQRQWRMQKVRKLYNKKRHATITIQRYIRGFLATKRVQNIKFMRQNEMNMKFFDFHAILIQKSFLGYMSRQYVHSFSKREKVLKEYKEAEEKVKRMMDAHVKELSETMKKEEIENQKTNFKNLAGKLHHLVSTQTIPGIYNPPYTKKPTAFGQEVETHLKTIFKEKYASGSFRKPLRLPPPT